MASVFHCDKCGACCRQLPLFGPTYASLDYGTGSCRYYDLETGLCSVYSLRPLICRVEEGYSIYFSLFSWEEYVKETTHACNILKANLKKR